MKKIFVVILCMMVILSLCACNSNKSESPNLTPQSDEEQTKETGRTNSSNNDSDDTDSYVTFSDARLDFDDYVTEIAENEEAVRDNLTVVTLPELAVFEYFTPLLYWGETLQDNELLAKDGVIKFITGDKKYFRSIDLQIENDNKYIMTSETNKDEEVIIKVEYHPNIDGLRLEATNNGEQALLFEYVKHGDGYAAQYYYDALISSTYYEEERAMCLFRYIFSSKEGSVARFNDVGEPDSILDGVPDEQDFIDGATHWFTLKDDEFTGELGGNTF